MAAQPLEGEEFNDGDRDLDDVVWGALTSKTNMDAWEEHTDDHGNTFWWVQSPHAMHMRSPACKPRHAAPAQVPHGERQERVEEGGHRVCPVRCPIAGGCPRRATRALPHTHAPAATATRMLQ